MATIYTMLLELLWSIDDSLASALNLNTHLSTTYFLNDSFYAEISSNITLVLMIKLGLCLIVLIAIRGGVPRYRYDFLTKIGWVKFLGYILSIFLLTLLFFILW